MDYSYSKPYQGMSGGPLPAGYLQAATLPGQYLAHGIEQFGQGIADAIRTYRQNKVENEYLDAKIEAGLAQYADPNKTGPMDMRNLFGIVGEKPLKKFVEGKATKGDKLAMAHSLDTFEATKAQKLQNQVNQVNLDEANRAIQQRNQAAEILKTAPTTKAVETPASEDLGGYESAIQRAIAQQQATGSGQVPVDPSQFQKPAQVQQVPMSQQEQEAALGDAFRKAGITDPKTLEGAVMLSRFGRRPEIAAQNLGNGISVVTQDGEAKQVVHTGPTPEQQQDLQARTIPGTNWVAPTKEEATKFRESQANVFQAKNLIKELLDLSNVSGKSLSPTMRAKGESLARQLGGIIRSETVGPGAVSEGERKILETIAANPARIWSFDSATRSALNTLSNSMDQHLSAKAQALGFAGAGPQQALKYDPVSRKLIK